MLTYYHGTDSQSAASIMANVQLPTRRSKAEMGDGFYVGNSCWRASVWAWHKAQKNYKVVKFCIMEIPFLKLHVIVMNRAEVNKFWNKKHIRKLGCDAAWGPVVGGHVRDTLQIKFESPRGINFIDQTYKVIL